MKAVSKYLLALFMVVAGTLHFLRPDFYLKIMPPYMPWPLELVVTVHESGWMSESVPKGGTGHRLAG